MIQNKWGDLSNDEERMLYIVKTTVRSLNTEELGHFLHFVTGSPTAPLDQIRVAFNGESGLKRAPSSSTCSSVLHVSTNYDTLNEFKSELCKVIGSPEAYVMDNI